MAMCVCEPICYRNAGAQHANKRLLRHLALVAIAFAQSTAMLGCAAGSYRFHAESTPPPSESIPASNPISVGGDHRQLDRMEAIVQYPAKKLRQWFPPKEKPLEPALARQASLSVAQEYLVANRLNDVYIDVREYDPGEQWRRLKSNPNIHPMWKYSGGLVSHVQYTLLPHRVFHVDSFNPYTNTLSLNSCQPTSALYHSASAKVIRSKTFPGAFATACYLPVFPLYRDVLVANDSLSYARYRSDWETERKLYPEIYGKFGADLVSQATSVIPQASTIPFYFQPLLSLGGGIAGSGTGQVVARYRDRERKSAAPTLPAAAQIAPTATSSPCDWNTSNRAATIPAPPIAGPTPSTAEVPYSLPQPLYSQLPMSSDPLIYGRPETFGQSPSVGQPDLLNDYRWHPIPPPSHP